MCVLKTIFQVQTLWTLEQIRILLTYCASAVIKNICKEILCNCILELTYVHCVVLRKCVGLLVAIFWNSEIVYTGFGIVLYAAVMLPRFYRCQDFSKSQVRKSKRKIFIRGLSKQIRLRFTGVSSR